MQRHTRHIFLNQNLSSKSKIGSQNLKINKQANKQTHKRISQTKLHQTKMKLSYSIIAIVTALSSSSTNASANVGGAVGAKDGSGGRTAGIRSITNTNTNIKDSTTDERLRSSGTDTVFATPGKPVKWLRSFPGDNNQVPSNKAAGNQGFALRSIPATGNSQVKSQTATEKGVSTSSFNQLESLLNNARDTWRTHFHSEVNEYYLYGYKRSCLCMEEFSGPNLAVIWDGQVSTVTDRHLQPVSKSFVPTIEELFTRIENAIHDQVHYMSVSFDDTYGYPTEIYIDYDEMIADEEFSFTIDHFVPYGILEYELDMNYNKWYEVASENDGNYQFAFDYQQYPFTHDGPYKIDVVNFGVQSATNHQGQSPPNGNTLTIEDMFYTIYDYLATANFHAGVPAFSLSVQFDSEYGYPTYVYIDEQEMLSDEEFIMSANLLQFGSSTNNNEGALEFKTTDGSSHCLDITYPDDGIAAGDSIIAFPCDGYYSQAWVHTSEGYIRAASDQSKCLVGKNYSAAKKEELILDNCPNDGTDDRFKFTKDTQTGEIRSMKYNTMCIDVSDSNFDDDGFRVLQFYECHGGDNQKWMW